MTTARLHGLIDAAFWALWIGYWAFVIALATNTPLGD